MIYRNFRWIEGMIFIGAAILAPAQTPEDAAWSKVVARQREGIRLHEQEMQATGDLRGRLNRQRVEAFRRAAAEMDSFIKTFLDDAASVRCLNATFRMGYYSELGDWDERALVLYNACRSHAKIRDSAAVFGEPPEPLATYVPLRIEVVSKRLNSAAASSTSVHNQMAFAKYSGKGGIDLNGIGPPRPLSLEDALRVAQRLSFPETAGRARVEWRHLLEQRPELKPVAEDASVAGMLVFGVKGTPAGVRQVASLLDSYRRDLTRRYFDSGLPGPTMVVLANLTALEEPIAAAGPRLAAMDAAEFANTAASQLTNAPASIANAAAPPIANVAAQPPVERQPQQQRQEIQQQQIPVPQQQQMQHQRIPSPMEQRTLESDRPRRQGASPEEIGRILSATVHFREMADMEGYFESLDHTLVLRKNLLNDRGQMFLGTGLHELVHALIQVDYPQAPMWLNEGMAALHEEYGPSEPHDNYRLYVARAAMTAGRWPALRELLEPHPVWWGSEARPVMVAAARYFCMLLWKEGSLPAAYRALRQAQATGEVAAAEVLERVTGMPIAQLETRWQADIAGRDLNSLDARWGELREPIQRYTQKIPPLAGIR